MEENAEKMTGLQEEAEKTAGSQAEEAEKTAGSQAEETIDLQAEGAQQEAEQPQQKASENRGERILQFIKKNKDVLILGVQLSLVAVVCYVGIRNDIEPCRCKCKCRKKKRKKR